MPLKEISDPLSMAENICKLREELRQLGTSLLYSNDAHAFYAAKKSARDEIPTPYFDHSVGDLSADRFFWAKLQDEQGATVALQAFRIDTIADTLASWAPVFTIGIYMQRGEMLAPSGKMPAPGSISERVTGRVAYHGELWVSRQWRPKSVFNSFTKLGLLLAMARWNPDAVWALTSKQMATHGHPTRMGYAHVEPAFFRWMWQGDDIPSEEWLLLADRASLALLASTATS